jgi:hypothetical protein
MDNSLIRSDAREFAEAFVPHPIRAHKAEDYQAAYEAGAKQVLRYLQQFAARANAQVPVDKASAFEAGQVDGILWSVDHLSTLFGID